MRPLQLTNTHQERRLRHFHAHNQDLKSLLGLDSSQTSSISLTVHPSALQSHLLQPQKELEQLPRDPAPSQ